jgi:hypothetical protein
LPRHSTCAFNAYFATGTPALPIPTILHLIGQHCTKTQHLPQAGLCTCAKSYAHLLWSILGVTRYSVSYVYDLQGNYSVDENQSICPLKSLLLQRTIFMGWQPFSETIKSPIDVMSRH